MDSPFDNKDDYADSDDDDIGGKDLFTVTLLIFTRKEDILLSWYLWLKKERYTGAKDLLNRISYLLDVTTAKPPCLLPDLSMIVNNSSEFE